MLDRLFGINTANAQITGTATSAAENVQSGTQEQFFELFSYVLSQIPLYITALLVLSLTWVCAKAAKAFVNNKLSERGVDEENKELQVLAVRISNIVVWIIGITAALSIVGIDLAPIVAAGAFGIGFAMRDLIMNLIAGMMILSAKHFKIGDLITVNGTTGKIVDIQTRATIVKSLDGTKVIVPNAELFKNRVVNKHGNPYRKIRIYVGVEYHTDLNLAIDAIKNAVNKIEHVMKKPKPSIKLWNWSESSIDIGISVWILSTGGKYGIVRHQLVEFITAELRKNNISFAFPSRTIYQASENLPQQPGGYLADNKLIGSENKPDSAPIAPAPAPQIEATSNTFAPAEAAPQAEATKTVSNKPAGLPVSPQPTINSDAAGWLKQTYTEQKTPPSTISAPAPQITTPAPQAEQATPNPQATPMPAPSAPNQQ